ncbi:hypothetical protein BsWGS_23331 [Bradybaena similaris]
MAFSQGPVTPGRKARRSWFDTPPLTHLDPQPVLGQQVSKRRSLDVVETLTLTHFTNPPRITFGKAIIGKTKQRTLLLRNPHDFEQEVIVERFPYKKKFMVNQTRFTVGPESTCSLEITWAPEEAGGYREMVQFYVNEVYRLQAFLIGTADKPKPPRKIRKYPLGPCVRNPPTVVQTPALSSIKASYSPTSRQVATELMEDMQRNHQCSVEVEDKENSESKRRDSHEAREIQEGGVLKLSKVSPGNENAIASAALNPVKMQTKPSTEDDCLKTPTPLESTTIVGKQETGRECLKNRRQWRNISDITTPTLNMSPIPVNDGTEHGMTVDSFFQPNDTCNRALTKADRLSELGHGKNVKRNNIQRMTPKDTAKDLKDTFVIPFAPAKSIKVTHKLKAAEDSILVSESEAAVSTAQQQIVQADQTRIIKVNETLLKNSYPVGNSLGLSEQLTSDHVDSNAESSTNLNTNHLDANKDSDVSPPKIPRNAALFDPSQISPRTMLDESLTLISQGKLPLWGMADSPDDKCPSINSSLISQGQGIISPNSFMEDMKSMMHNSYCGIGNEPKNISTPNISSPLVILNSSIPHNAMVNHLESVRLSLHDSPMLVSSECGTPRKLLKTFMHKRKSITSQFQKEEKKRIATAAQVIKKDQQLIGDGTKQFTNKYNVFKKHALTKSNGRLHNLNAIGSPKRETFILKKKEIEGKKAAVRSPLGKKSGRRSTPKRRSPRSSPQEIDLRSVKNKKCRRKSSPRKPLGRTSQVKKSPTRNSDPIMPKIMSKIRANMMMTGDMLWNLATPQKDLQLPGPCTANPCKAVDQPEDWKQRENNTEASYFSHLPPAESKTTEEIIGENPLTKNIKLFPDLHESTCYRNDEEYLLAKDNEIKVNGSDIDRNTDDAADIERKERETSCKTQLEHKHCVSEIETSENNVVKTHSACQVERVVTESERTLSAKRFDTLSPNNLPTSPEGHLDLSRRGTITVTKSRPSDALLTAMNNRKRLFQDSPQRTPYSITDDNKETQENISVKFEEHYQEIDGKLYVIVKETTDVVKSTTETYIEEMSISPQQFATPLRLPNSPDLHVSRRSTHIVRSPKVVNSDSVYRRQLDFGDEVEGSVVDNDETKNLVNENALKTDNELNNSELSENCSVIKSDTFEKEPSLLITPDRRDIFIDSSAPAITSVCTISRRLVSYDDGSETCSTANVTKDSLDISHSTDSLGCSFNDAHAPLEAKNPVNKKQIDKEDMPFAMDAEESTIQLNWEVLAKDESDVNVMFESDQENYRECKNFSRTDGGHVAAAEEQSEDEQFYDTLSENYYDAVSDAENPEVELLDELTISSKYLESIAAESGKYPSVAVNSGFGKCDVFSEAGERQCSVLSGRLLVKPHTDTCVQLTEASTTVPVNLDEHAVRTEVSIDHMELFEVIERKMISLSSAAELQPVEEVVRSTPEAKAKRKLRRSVSASDLLEHSCDLQEHSCDLLKHSCDLLENQHMLDEAEPHVSSVAKEATPRKLIASSKSAVFRNYAGQVLAKYSPKNVSRGQPPCSKTTQIMATQRSQSMTNLAKQAERVRPVRTEQHTNTNRIARQANQVTKSASKQKTIKGVAQSKLFLVKKSKTAAARHPLLYAAKNMYYDERWMEKQERGFVQWLNFVLTPPDEYVAVANKAKVDARSLSLDVDHVTPRLAPTKEILSFRAYAARRRLNRLRRGACELYQSDALVGVIRKIEVEVESRRISARRDKMIHADVGIKQKLLDLLLHYSPLWLRIGLETIFGEVLMLQSNQDVMGLSRFILTRLLASPYIAAEFAHPTVPHLYKEGYVDSVSRHTVKKFLLLVYFLDQAKLGHLIDHDPCLFCKDAGIKSSKEVLIEFSREVLSGEGDITRHLAYLGYTVSHSQKPIDEFDFAVTNLSSDLRDGLRLCRVLEFLAGDHNIMAKLRTPAISRLQKIHNTELFFKALHEQGLDFNLVPGSVTARDVVDGHREKTLSLLWQLIIHFQSSVLVNETHLKEEIDILMKSLRLKIAMQKIGALSIEDCQARRDSGDTKLLMENQRLQLIFQWCRLVCLHYGLKIENFTVSFSDGRALCCLLHHYHPALLPLAEIRFETTISAQENEEDKYQRDIEDSVDSTVACASDEDNPEVFERLLANEKSNYKTLYDKASALGGVPLMLKSTDMSNTIPDEKVVSTFVSYLCARLLDIREEVRAARIIQMAWRKKQLRKQFLERQRKTKAAVTIQHWFQSMLVKYQKVREMEVQAAVHIQAAWRSFTARLYVGRLKQMIQEGEKKDHSELANVTSKLQRLWQPQLVEHYHMILLKQQKQQERVWRIAEEAAITIQKHVRRFQCRKEFIRQQASVIKIQTLWRRHLAKKILCTLKNEQRENSAVVIQKWMKRHFWLSLYRKKRNAVISLQKCWRMRQSRRTLQALSTEKYSRAATTIQKHVRAKLVQKKFQKIKQAVVVVQCHWRMKQAKTKLAMLRAERENRAAVLLQNYMKSIICRQKYIRLRNATVLLQRNWRQTIAQRKLIALKSEKDNEAAIVIQKYYKRHKVQCQFRKQQKSAILIQSTWRMLQAKKQLLALQHRRQEQDKAAIVIQKNFKRYKAQQQFRAQQKSAILIQSVRRMLQAKRQLLSLKQKKQEEDNKAAIVIQKSFKRYKAQQQFRAQQKSAILIQSMWRMLQAKKEFLSLKQKKRERSATLIQSYFRRFRCKQEFQLYRNAAITIQKTWRMHCAKNVLRKLQLENQIQAAIEIQRIYRGFIQRRSYIQLKLAAVILQKWWTMVLSKKLSDRLRNQQQEHAALVLQRNFKMWKHRNDFLKLKSSAVVLQTTWKMVRARRLFLTWRSVKQERSALCIQKMWRGYVARKMLASKRRAASVVQSWWRMSQAKQQYWRMKEATLLIQAWYRAVVVRKHLQTVFFNQKAAAIHIQSWWRGIVIRRKLQTMKHSALILQAHYRRFQSRRAFLAMKKAAVVIQNHYRSFILGQEVRKEYLTLKSATVTIQRGFRTYLHKKIGKQNAAALVLQTVFRKIRARRKYTEQKQAAQTIQKYFRGYQKTRTIRQNFQHQKQAAQTIKKYFREYQKTRAIRQQFLQQKQAASIIQRTYRVFVVRRKYLHIRQSVIKIQAHIKGRIVQKEFQKLKHAAVTIQVHFRAVRLSKINRKAFLQFRASAIIIQRFYRSAMIQRKALKDVAQQHSAAVLIQAVYRGWSQRNKYLLLQAATVMIQRWYRSYLAGEAVRAEMMCMRQAACVIQKQFRLYKQVLEARRQILELRAEKQREIIRKLEEDKCDIKGEVSVTNAVVENRTEETRREHAAIVIQKVVRGYQTRIRDLEELAKADAAARVIQNRWREVSDRRQCQQEFVAKCEAAIVVQTYFRMRSQRQCFQENIRLVVALQACIRTFIQRHRYQESIKRVVKLQRRVRSLQQMKKNRKQFLKLNQGAVTDKTSVLSELTQRPDHPAESVLTIQSPCKVQQELDACNDFEASDAEKKFMEVKQQIDKETLAAQSLRHTHPSCEDVTRHFSVQDFEATDAEKKFIEVQLLDKESEVAAESLCHTYQSCEDVTRHLAAKDFEATDAEKEFIEVHLLDKESAVTAQSLCHTYTSCEDMTRHLAAKDFEATDAEKEFIEVQLLDKETLTAQSLCHAYPSCEDVTRHLAPIDVCTGQQFKEIYQQEQNASAIVIQRAVRRYICRRKMIKIQCIVLIQANIRQFLCRRQFLARVQSVIRLQAVVRGWIARRSTAELRKRHKATICLQAHLRGYVVRKAYSTLLREKMQSVWRQKKEHGAAITIQARWRGFATRKNTKDRKLTQARKRLKEANRQATEEKTLGSRTASALDFLLREKDVGHILEALMHLEVCTRLSPICCERLVEVNAVSGLYRLIASCNRSVPHMELIKYSVSILLNLAKYEKTIAAVLEPQDSVATILELLHIYRQKGAIFNYCCMLLGILGLHPDRRVVILNNPLIVDRLQSIHALSLRKHRLNRNRQVTQAKMAAFRSFNCTLPVLTPSKCKVRRIRPEWALAGDTIKDFDDPITAVTFVMDALQIGPKM